MRLASFVIVSTLFQPSSAFANVQSLLELIEGSGELCPAAKDIQLHEEKGVSTLELNLAKLPAVEAEGDILSARRSCTYKFKVAPGEAYEVAASEIDYRGSYNYEKAGRVFVSIAERTLAGDDQILSHSLVGRHRSESGSYNFSDRFEGWADKGLECGTAFDLTLSLNLTARKSNVAGPTQGKAEQLIYRIHTKPCKAVLTR